MTIRSIDVNQLLTQTVAIPAATLIQVGPVAGQAWAQLRYVSGGSLEIGGTYSLDQNGATIGTTFGNGYLLSTTFPVEAQISGTFWLYATGATAVATIVRGLTQGV